MRNGRLLIIIAVAVVLLVPQLRAVLSQALWLPVQIGRTGMGAILELLLFVFVLLVVLPVLVIVGGFVIAALKTLRGSVAPEQADDTRLIQEIYQGLQRMEQRVEALETLLLEKERKDR